MAESDGPTVVICQLGHINSGAFDPMPAIIELCRQHGAWCHVDGAFGLWAAFLRALRAICASCSRVVPNSWKWRFAIMAIHTAADAAP